MKRTIRTLSFLLVAAALFTIAGLPWTLIAGADLWFSPLVGFVALLVSK